MTEIRRFWYLIFPLACNASLALASPTSNDFAPCHQQASRMLLACLDKNPGANNDHCWMESKRATHACYDKTNESYRPDKAKIEAKKKAMEQAELEKKKAMEQEPK